MMLKRCLQVAVPAAALALLALPALAQDSSRIPAPVKMPAWDINLPAADGTLLNVSPVAARVRFDNGSNRVFSISHPEYEQLRDKTGTQITFEVRHNVLHANNT